MKLKLATVCLVSAFSSSLSAAPKDIEFVFFYPPGGPQDVQVSSLKANLESQGYTVTKTFAKTCSEASALVIQKPDSRILVSETMDFLWAFENTGSKCAPTSATPALAPLARMGSVPIMLCYAPGAVADYKKQKVTVGYATVPIFDYALLPITAANSNLVPTPYRGGAASRGAVLSKDVTMFFSGSLAAEFVPQGSKCVGSSMKDNWGGYPHFSQVFGINYPEVSVTSYFVTAANGSQRKEFEQAIKKSLQSDEFKKSLLARKAVYLGEKDTPESLKETLANEERALFGRQ